jgi:hypothetical protein
MTVMAALLAAACNSMSRPSTTAPHPQTPNPRPSDSGPPAPAGSLRGEATQLLDAVVVPPRATRTPRLSGEWFQRSPQGTSCTSAVDEDRMWTVPGSQQ